jgi:C-terminal processing protease CtpA/Prc
LQLDIRNDPQLFGKGLFLFGFLTEGSRAEQQGVLQAGDEVLEVNGVNVAGGSAEDVAAVLRQDVFPDVLLKVHRAVRAPSMASSKKVTSHYYTCMT